MVASFMEKSVSKSFVRLPGSGSDKRAGASFCDLSRGSSLAASITVPQQMGMQRSLNAKLAPTTQNKRPRTEDNTDVTIQSAKKPCLERSVQNVASNPSEHTFQPVTVYAAPVTVSYQGIGGNIITTAIRPSNVPLRATQNPAQMNIQNNPVVDVSKLQEENVQLKSENASLHKQLSLFKQLMRNPQRLQSVLQRLNERQN